MDPNCQRAQKDLARWEGVKNDYLVGMSLGEIAEKYGYKHSTAVSAALKRYGVETKRNQWTDEEILVLREVYPFGDWNLILSKLARHPKTSIIDKACELGIRMPDSHWTEEEINILKDNYNSISLSKIVQLLPNRSYKSISTKAKKLGLAKSQRWTTEEIQLLNEIYPFARPQELERIFGRQKEAIAMKACSLGLKKASRYESDLIREELLLKLKQFAEELGRTPVQADFSSRDDMPGNTAYHRYFGSYNNACRLAGIPINPKRYGAKEIQVLPASSGDICNSVAELKITEFLIENNIGFQKEVLYRDIIKDKRCGQMRCDWLLDGPTIVEYFGLAGKPQYDAKIKKKQTLCAEHGFRLISIMPNQINKLEVVFADFLNSVA